MDDNFIEHGNDGFGSRLRKSYKKYFKFLTKKFGYYKYVWYIISGSKKYFLINTN